MSETRKLAAILVADVVGYSRLAGADEERTLARLRGLRSDLIDPAVAAHHGRIVKHAGDGSIVEFRSVVDAVRCAIEVQSGLIERNAGVPPDRRIDFRVGVHVGDVVEESDGDLMGDGVNIAARLEGVAKPGAICLSEDAYRQVKSRLDLKVSDLGPVQLKNIAEPVHAYSLEVGKAAEPKPPPPTPTSALTPLASRRRWGSGPLAAVAALAFLLAASGWFLLAGRLTKPAEAAHLSVVVLPFTNLSGDPSQDYFADGVTENLTTELSRIRDSFVIARNTAFTYKGKSIDAKEIGKELGVRYVLEGSVQRDQSRVRVNAQLIDAETGAHLWADRFEEDTADLFKLQDEVVARLARSLDLALTKAEATRGLRSGNPDVIDLSLQGWTLIWRGFQQPMAERQRSVYEARRLLDEALKIDPDDPDALAGSAYTYGHDYIQGWAAPPTDYEAKVLGQVNRAIARDPDNVRAYFVKAVYLSTSHRHLEALAAADAGLAVNPNFTPLFSPRINAENSLGRFEQGKADAERAMMRLSRRDPYMGRFQVEVGDAELSLGHFDAAIAEYHKAIDSGLSTYYAHSNLSAAYAQAGRMEEAKAALSEARRLNPNLTVRWMTEHMPNLPAVFDGVRKAGLAEE
ncbi:MAG: adenylate/guanylate cyclase domain-containing protein [Hyphomicrobiales bacterium]|nr:adenylate/guanylate cyclase domain-containing protein [Hyphomicrobiales bacterium]